MRLKILSKRLHLIAELDFDLLSSTEPGGYIQWDEFVTEASRLIHPGINGPGNYVHMLADYVST